ncbi:MAG: xanthine dehydrogenase family protein subunit M [Bauldia litoralis]
MTPFELMEPTSLKEALGLLDRDDPDVRPWGGGTALMLMMKAGALKPTRLVSLRRVDGGLSKIEAGVDGGLRLGALTPLAAVERSDAVRRAAPVVTRTLRTLSNIRVRNVATLGGHLAHGDPHMDLPPVLMALDATVTVAGPDGSRELAMADLFTGFFETALAGDELITAVTVPAQPTTAGYVKCTTRSADDWPALGVAVALDLDGGTVRGARVAVSAATEQPARLAQAEAALTGTALDAAALKRAGEAAAEEAEIVSDIQGSADYKRQLLRVSLGRAVRQALDAGNQGAGR